MGQKCFSGIAGKNIVGVKMVMETVTGYMALFLMFIIFVLLIYIELLLLRTFNRCYPGTQKTGVLVKNQLASG